MTCCKMARRRPVVSTEIKHEVQLWKSWKAAMNPFDNNVARTSMASAVGTYIFIIIYIYQFIIIDNYGWPLPPKIM